MRVHSGLKPFECSECDYKTCEAGNLRRHVRDRHNSVKNKKREAEKKRKEERKEIRKIKMKSIMQCRLCFKWFSGKASLKDHLRNCHTGNYKTYECHICEKVVKTKPFLRLHISRHLQNQEGRPKTPCKICGKILQDQRTLKAHMKIHDEKREKTHACDKCQAMFYSRHQLKAHLQGVHNDGKLFDCNMCPVKLQSLTRLKEHVKFVHGNPEKKFSCGKCNKKYYHKKALQNHMKVQHDGIRITCPLCRKQLRSRSAKDYHLLSHKGERKLKCQLCTNRPLFTNVNWSLIKPLTDEEKT